MLLVIMMMLGFQTSEAYPMFNHSELDQTFQSALEAHRQNDGQLKTDNKNLGLINTIICMKWLVELRIWRNMSMALHNRRVLGETL